MPKPLNLIAACAENRLIGRDGRLPWRIPEDMAFLHAQTRGQIVVLGRVCYETWPAAAREGRRAIVLTRDQSLAKENVSVVSSLPSALAEAESLPGEIYVCGGESIFREAIALPQTHRLYLTLVHAQVQGDRLFPEWRDRFTREVSRRESADANWRYTFLTLERDGVSANGSSVKQVLQPNSQ